MRLDNMGKEPETIGELSIVLYAMNDSLEKLHKKADYTNGKVAENLRQIALIKQETERFIDSSGLNKRLWTIAASAITLIGVFGFLAQGWFDNAINSALDDKMGLYKEMDKLRDQN